MNDGVVVFLFPYLLFFFFLSHLEKQSLSDSSLLFPLLLSWFLCLQRRVYILRIALSICTELGELLLSPCVSIAGSQSTQNHGWAITPSNEMRS